MQKTRLQILKLTAGAILSGYALRFEADMILMRNSCYITRMII